MARNSGFPRAAGLVGWLLGGIGVVILVALIWVSLSLPGNSQQIQQQADADAHSSAQQATQRFPAVAQNGTLTDAQIRSVLTQSQGQLRGIRRQPSVITVTALITGTRSGSFGPVVANLCVEYDLSLPVEAGSRVDQREASSC